MRILLFLGFLALSMLVPVGLAQAHAAVGIDQMRAETISILIEIQPEFD